MKITPLFFSLSGIWSTIKNSDKKPSLIDREVFFGDPLISGAQLSPDGNYISFLRPYEKTRNIWVKTRDQSFEEAVPLTHQKSRPISNYFWSRDGKYILFIKDNEGDENFNIYAVNPADLEKTPTPDLHNLTELDGVRAIIYHLCRKDTDLLYIGLNDRDPAWHDLYSLRISTGELIKIRENTGRYLNWLFDFEDRLRMAVRNREDGTGELWRLDSGGEEKLLEWSILEMVSPLVFHRDNQHLYLVSNKGEENDLSALYLLNIETGTMELIERDPEAKVDFGGLFYSERNKSIISTSYTDDRSRYYFVEAEYEGRFRKIEAELSGVEVSMRSPTLDEKWWLVSAYSDTEPGITYLYDWDNEELSFQYKIRPEIPRESLSSMYPISYSSTDGLKIPSYLTLPRGFGTKNLPLVVMPHGGPWVRDYWGYNNFVQFLANRGYAVLNPNFRISTGYGKAFLNAGNRQWGDLMQDDLTSGVKYLIEEGVVDKNRVGIFGGSYGGYATLAGLAFTPEVYACGVSFVGPSNLITLLESIPPYWEAGRKMFHTRMGDPTTEEGRKELIRQSPLNSAHQIQAPLMVVQGQNDPRVKKSESDQIVVALRDRGFPVAYLNAPDEGHGFARPINNISFIAAMEKFLAEYLEGRYQEYMPAEVAQRLDEITVDVDSVELKN